MIKRAPNWRSKLDLLVGCEDVEVDVLVVGVVEGGLVDVGVVVVEGATEGSMRIAV